MTTEHKDIALTGEVVKNEGEESVESHELSIRRLLLPSLLEEKRDKSHSIQNVAAFIVILLIIAGLLALYIHGASIA